jgi:hypothetical protein
MKNPFKKYAIISIIINLLLMMIYLCCFHSSTAFRDYKNITSTIKTVNEAFAKDNTRTIKRASYELNFKPKLKPHVVKVFDTNTFLIKDFISLKDRLLRLDNFSKKEANIIFDEYKNALSSLQDCFDTGIHHSQKEAKLKNSEVEEKIKNFNLNTESIFDQKDIKGLYKEELELILMAMENDLVLAQTTSNRDFESYSWRRGCGITRYFPITLDMPNDVEKGKMLDTKIGLGFFAGSYPAQFSVFLNGQKIDTKEVCKLEIDTNSLGKQRMEAVVVWTNPYTNETSKDTTHFEYTVTP